MRHVCTSLCRTATISLSRLVLAAAALPCARSASGDRPSCSGGPMPWKRPCFLALLASSMPLLAPSKRRSRVMHNHVSRHPKTKAQPKPLTGEGLVMGSLMGPDRAYTQIGSLAVPTRHYPMTGHLSAAMQHMVLAAVAKSCTCGILMEAHQICLQRASYKRGVCALHQCSCPMLVPCVPGGRCVDICVCIHGTDQWGGDTPALILIRSVAI